MVQLAASQQTPNMRNWTESKRSNADNTPQDTHITTQKKGKCNTLCHFPFSAFLLLV